MHISRALIFAEAMLRHLEAPPEDRFAVRWAVAFHDLGRQDNGPDRWEPVSAVLCERYLIDRGLEARRADAIGRLIIKRNKHELSIQQIVTDADVLDIMRPVSGAGLRGFHRRRLGFCAGQDSIRDRLIQDAYRLIHETEGKRTKYLAMESPLRGMCEWIARTKKAPCLKALLGV